MNELTEMNRPKSINFIKTWKLECDRLPNKLWSIALHKISINLYCVIDRGQDVINRVVQNTWPEAMGTETFICDQLHNRLRSIAQKLSIDIFWTATVINSKDIFAMWHDQSHEQWRSSHESDDWSQGSKQP